MGVQSLPLTNVTADQLKAELIDRIKAFFPDWSDQQDSNNMIMLLEQIAALSEMEYAYINRMAREAFIQFAIDPRNVDAHARGLGYIPRYQSPSIATAVIQSAMPLAAATVIPAGSKFGTVLPGIMYETVDNVVMLAGETESDPVTLKQQESWFDDFVGTGNANQQVALNHGKVMPATIEVIIDGAVWNYVENFVDSDPTSLVFTWYVDPDGNATVIFGNGMNGKKPPVNAAGRVFYKTGGGKAGAIGIKQLAMCLSEVRDAGSGALLSLTAVNDQPAAPGSDKETIAQIRKHAIANLRAPRALLTLTDIEEAVSSLAGVLVAKAVNWELVEGLPHYMVQVYVVPNGLGDPTNELIADVVELLTITKPVVMGHKVTVVGPTYKNLDYKLQVNAKAGYSELAVKNAVKQQLVQLFDPAIENSWGFTPEFGMELYTSQIIAILQQVDGVRNLAILTPGDVKLAMNEFPVVGNVTFA